MRWSANILFEYTKSLEFRTRAVYNLLSLVTLAVRIDKDHYERRQFTQIPRKIN